MTAIYYDTEFIEDGRTIDLISIGMVREDGAELYLVNLDMPFGPISRHPWLMSNVMPHLPVRVDHPSPFDSEHPDYLAIKPHASIAAEVRRFITDTTNPQLWAWYGAYDHVVLAQLFGPMINLPTGIPMWTNDLRQECERLGNPRMPEQAAGAHNALADARHNRVMAKHLRAIAAGGAS